MNAHNSSAPAAEMIIHNGRISTMDNEQPFVPAVAIADGRFIAVGSEPEVMEYPEANRLGREAALRLSTVGSSWFSAEEGKKGQVATGQLADPAVLSADYFSVPEEEIRGIEALLTIVGGKIVYGSGEFATLAPAPLPVSPDWSPVGRYGGYHHGTAPPAANRMQCARHYPKPAGQPMASPLWGLGCDCFAF